MEMSKADGPGGLSLASHRGGQDSLPGLSMWGMWSVKWYWDRLSSEYRGVRLSVSFQQSSTLIHSSIKDAVQSYKQRVPLNSTDKKKTWKCEHGVIGTSQGMVLIYLKRGELNFFFVWLWLWLYRASWYYQSLFHFHQRMHYIFALFSPGATTPIGGCILQPSSGL